MIIRIAPFSIALLFSMLSPNSVHAQLSSLEWMIGEWVMEKDGMTTTEKWWSDNDSTIQGNSTTFKNGELVFEEHLKIIDRNGSISYVAILPSKTADFTLTESENNTVKFADMMNDFPQLISYSRKGDQMQIVLTGLEKGEFLRTVMNFTKQ